MAKSIKNYFLACKEYQIEKISENLDSLKFLIKALFFSVFLFSLILPLVSLAQISEIPENFQFEEGLYRGLQSDEVKYLQIVLKELGPEIYPEGLTTGYYGSLTVKAVTNFQLKYEIIASTNHSAAGYVGPSTRAKLNEILSNLRETIESEKETTPAKSKSSKESEPEKTVVSEPKPSSSNQTISGDLTVEGNIKASRLYQEDGDLIINTLGSGNLMLNAATGLHLYGSQIVIDSTSLINPLVYIESPLRVKGSLTQTDSGQVSFSGNVSAGSGLDVTGGDLTVGGTYFTVDEATGNITTVGTLTVSGAATLTTLTVSTINSSGKLTITDTSAPQITLKYDTSNYLDISIGSDGTVTFNTFGTSQKFSFQDDVEISGNATTSGNLIVGGTIWSTDIQKETGQIKWFSGGGVPLEKTSEAVVTDGQLGFVSYSGKNYVANLIVTKYDGTILYSNDFTDDTLDQIPAGFAQWDSVDDSTADWQVKEDATHPSGRAVVNQTPGNFWTNLYCTEYTPPTDGRYIIQVDVKAENGAGLWNMGASFFQQSEGDFYQLHWTHDSWLVLRKYGAADMQARVSDDYTSSKNIWFRVKIVLDGQRAWGYITTLAADAPSMWININWGKTLTLFESPGPIEQDSTGMVKQIWITKDNATDVTLKIYYDGDATPTINLPCADFFMGDTDTVYMSRYVGQTTAEKSYYRYIDIPYSDGIKIVLENEVDSDNTIWWQVAYTTDYPDGRKYMSRLYADRHSAAVAPLDWEEYLNISGNGAVHSIYQYISNTTNANYMEGNHRIYIDGEASPSLEAPGCEDFSLNSFGWTIQGCTDFVGTPYKSLAGTPYEVSHYRIFIEDPIRFNTSIKIKWQAGQETEAVPTGSTTSTTVVFYYKDN